jgi:hypothetical protein
MWHDSWASLLARNFATPCIGREPKARVATWPFYVVCHVAIRYDVLIVLIMIDVGKNKFTFGLPSL